MSEYLSNPSRESAEDDSTTLDSQTADRSLQLDRPLAVLDVQSTGLEPSTARIVKLSVLKVDPDGTEHVRSVIVNPESAIPPGATQVHGLTDLDVKDQPVFRSYARALAQHLENCDLAGFGIERFGLPLLQAEFERSGVEFDVSDRAVVDTMVVFHRLEPRNLNSAYARFVGGVRPESGEPAQNARDVLAILKGQIASESSVPQMPETIEKWSKGIDDSAIDPEGKFVWSEEGDALINFGKHRGERLVEVVKNDFSYLNWVSGSDDFEPEVRKIAESAIDGYLPERDRSVKSESRPKTETKADTD